MFKYKVYVRVVLYLIHKERESLIKRSLIHPFQLFQLDFTKVSASKFAQPHSTVKLTIAASAGELASGAYLVMAPWMSAGRPFIFQSFTEMKEEMRENVFLIATTCFFWKGE